MKTDKRAEDYLNGLPMWAKRKNSLEDIGAFLQEMGNPDRNMKIFHVAGTNGKGSVCAFMESVLTKAGHKTGSFTSPHLIDTKERFSLNGEMISAGEFEESFRAVKALSETMMGKGFCHPTYFEFLFYMAMDWFVKAGVKYAILETGLGGRLDATNAVREPLVTVITSVSLDHMQYLGDTIPKIAAEKAGIVKRGVPLVFDGNDDQAALVVENRAKELQVPYYQGTVREVEILERGRSGYKVRFRTISGEAVDLPVPSAAEYQVMNAWLAFRALEVAGLREHALAKKREFAAGFSAMRWPGRMEEVLPFVFLDGAHNPAGMKAFVKAAGRLCKEWGRRAYLLFSAVSEKDYKGMIEEMRMLPLDKVWAAGLECERGLEVERLLQEFGAEMGRESNIPITGSPTAEAALLDMLSQRDERHILFCAGSLYLMGEIKEALRRNHCD